jgi:hypothetical protein
MSEEYLDDEIEVSSDFDKMVEEALLIELIQNKQAEVFENVVFFGKRRYYVEDLSKRDFHLENTTPYQIKILDNLIIETSWTNLVCKVAQLLLTLYPEMETNIFDFRCDWTKAKMFSTEQKTNYKKVKDNLFVNCNHTALHSCWLIQDLLNYFKIDTTQVYCLIHRPCSMEPQKTREYIEKRFIGGFKDFIIIQLNKDDAYAEKVISFFYKCLNPMLARISRSYTNFFLFDDMATLYNYLKKVRDAVDAHPNSDKKIKGVLNHCLDLLLAYYKK